MLKILHKIFYETYFTGLAALFVRDLKVKVKIILCCELLLYPCSCYRVNGLKCLIFGFLQAFVYV